MKRFCRHVFSSVLRHTVEPAAPIFSLRNHMFLRRCSSFNRVIEEALAAKGNPEAQYRLGAFLWKNPDTPKESESASEVVKEIRIIKTYNSKRKARISRVAEVDASEETAMSWTRRAAEQGHKKAMVLLGNMLIDSDKEADVSEGVDWYRKAASGEGDVPVEALFNLGTIYNDGNEKAGISSDESLALGYFSKAAELGDADSLYWLGHCWASGEGGVGADAVDPMRAIRFLGEAAEKGHRKANYYLANIYRSGLTGGHSCVTGNVDKFYEYLMKAANQDEDADAIANLAELTFIGNDRVPRDPPRAVELYSKASRLGSDIASLFLGVLHYNGCEELAIQQNKRVAFDFYNLAAEQGSQEAWRNLASMYFLGDGVPQSEDTAREIMRVIFGRKDAKGSNPT